MTGNPVRRSLSITLAMLVVCYLATIALVGPFREASFSDDWAYALTVRHLLETGQFRMHDWLASNSPFQTYWGALFSTLLGYSFASLRLSTLTLMLVGLVAFYFLALEHDLSERQAGLLTLVLMASPLALGFSFTFMTDVPFLTWVIVGLLLYTRAIRSQSYLLMLLASLAASAAVLTRQFGVAFVPGLLLVWLLDRRRQHSIVFFLAGIVLPAVAAAWQVHGGMTESNWAGRWVAQRQAEYFRDIGALIAHTGWRVTVTLQYLALFCLPLVPVAIVDFGSALRFRGLERYEPQPLHLVGTLLIATFMGATTAYAVLALHLPLWMPLLSWNFDLVKPWSPTAARSLTLFMLLGGLLFGRFFLLRYAGRPRWRDLPTHQHVLDAVTQFLFLAQLIFFQFGDEYLLHLLPCTLILAGRALSGWLDRLRGPIVALTLGVLAVSALWIRGTLAGLEAQWQAGEGLLAAGIAPEVISSPASEWHSYHGAFETYLAQRDDRADVASYYDYWAHWLPVQKKSAEYVIMQLPVRPRRRTLEVVSVISYRDVLFEEQHVYVLRRRPQ